MRYVAYCDPIYLQCRCARGSTWLSADQTERACTGFEGNMSWMRWGGIVMPTMMGECAIEMIKERARLA